MRRAACGCFPCPPAPANSSLSFLSTLSSKGAYLLEVNRTWLVPWGLGEEFSCI